MSDNSDRSLRILMLACIPFFSNRGTPISVGSRLEILSGLGHEVDLVTYHVGNEVVLPGLVIHRTMNITFIKEVPVGPSFRKVLLDILVFFKALRLLLNRKYNLIHTHEEASYIGAIFSKIFRIRHLYDFHSSLPQVMKNFGYERYRILLSILAHIEKRILKSCKGVITISKDLDIYVAGINDKVPRVIIENFQPYGHKSMGKELSGAFINFMSELNGNKVVLYSGTFEHYQGLGLLLDAAESVAESRNNIIFVLAGGNQYQIDSLKKSAEMRGIGSNLHFTGNLPIEEVTQYVNIADVLISTRTIGNNPPLKIYDYLGSGKPIVATNIRAHTQVLNDDIAVLVDTNPESVAEGILSILENPAYAKALGQRSREFYKSKYDENDRKESIRYFLDAVMKENL